MNLKTKKYRLSSFSVLVVFVLLVIMGASLISMLNVQLNPSRSLPNLSVEYSWHNASARVIEQEVTSKLEGLFNAVNGIEEVSSVTSRGSGSISLSFKENVNLDAIRFEIASLIRQVYPELPEEVSFPQISLSSSGTLREPILAYTLNGSASPYYIQKYAEDHLVPALSLIEGIYEVRVSGSTPYEWEIKYNSDRIQTLGISVTDIQQGINNYFQDSYLGQGNTSKVGNEDALITGVYLASVSPSDSVDWRSIPIKKVDNRIFTLGDLATVTYKEQEPTSYYRINGLNTINMVIYPEDDVNTIRLGGTIKDKIASLRAELPAGYSLLLASDSTEYVVDELKMVGMRTIFSLLILLTFVLLISRQLKYLLLIFLSIVANLLVACILYYALKIDIHLYSLAGITISFGIIIDNSIIMIDHIRHQGNRKAFIAILAATLTTIGALSMVFFLKEEQQLNLVEFAQVIIVNLAVSMAVALFFIPALMDKVKLEVKKSKSFFRRKRRVLKLTNKYTRFILWSKRHKWIYVTLFILGFGIPIHWLPTEIEEEGKWADRYNKTLGSTVITEDVRPVLEKIFGGSLRLFTEYVFESSYYSEPGQTTLYVSGIMPEGCTIQQLNDAIVLMENFISKYDEVDMFQTSISGYNSSIIIITFKPEFENSSFPYVLKEAITSKAISLGGLDWSVTGVGQGFSNALGTSSGNQSISLEGYNYDELYGYAEQLKGLLEENERVQNVEIRGGTNTYYYYSRPTTLYEYYLDFDQEGFGLNEVSVGQFYNFLRNKVYRGGLMSVYQDNEAQPVSLVADSYGEYNVWDLRNRPVSIGDGTYKLVDFGDISKQKDR